MMTNQEIFQIALQQSAYDCNCNADDFLLDKNKVVLSQVNEKARAYLPLPLNAIWYPTAIILLLRLVQE